jgi:hypothetical protein
MLKSALLLAAGASALIATPAQAWYRHHHHYYRHHRFYAYYSPYSYAYPAYAYSYPVYYSYPAYPAYYAYPAYGYPSYGVSISFGGGFHHRYHHW